MKKLRIITMFIIFILLMSIAHHLCKKIKEKNTIEENTVTLPAFSFATLNKTQFDRTDIKNIDGRVIINFFNPTCEHCQYMVTQFLKNKEPLKDVTILMVTIADSSSIAKFDKDYQLYTLPNIVLLRDTKFQFYKIFGTATVPSFFIYEHQKLIKKIIGETKTESS